MNSRTPDRKRRVAPAALACLFACWIVAGTSEAQESPILDYVDQKLLDIGAQLQNAKMRLTRDFAGVGSGDAGPTTTPVIDCCRPNLVTIERKLKEMRGGMDQMLAYYREQRNTTAVGIVAEMNEWLGGLNTGMYYFARAPDKPNAFAARNGLIRPWNGFRNGIDALRRCCPIPPEVVPEAVADGAGQTAEEPAGGTSKKSNEATQDKKQQDPGAP